MLYPLARSALFRLDAETAHHLTLSLLERAPVLATVGTGVAPSAPVDWLGMRLRNRVGMAAGLDKNGRCLPAWERMGFGFVEVGTVTPRPQAGNPRPRMFRLPEQQALINRLGFNNEGVAALVQRLHARPYRGVLGINIGKNADTPLERAAEDYLSCLQQVYLYASYVTVNISSPNTRNLRDLQDEARLADLLRQLGQARRQLADRHGRWVPLLVKIAPDLGPEQLEPIARLAVELGIDGLIATNTTLSREGVQGHPLAAEAGGLSGAPLRVRAQTVLERLRALLGPRYPLIGVGGISSGADARERRQAGADLVQLYTGLIYRGPALVSECASALAD